MTFFKKNIKVKSIGLLDPFPEDLKDSLAKVKEQTKDFENLTVTFALNYGGRDDIVRAVNTLIKNGNKIIKCDLTTLNKNEVVYSQANTPSYFAFHICRQRRWTTPNIFNYIINIIFSTNISNNNKSPIIKCNTQTSYHQ